MHPFVRKVDSLKEYSGAQGDLFGGFVAERSPNRAYVIPIDAAKTSRLFDDVLRDARESGEHTQGLFVLPVPNISEELLQDTCDYLARHPMGGPALPMPSNGVAAGGAQSPTSRGAGGGVSSGITLVYPPPAIDPSMPLINMTFEEYYPPAREGTGNWDHQFAMWLLTHRGTRPDIAAKLQEPNRLHELTPDDYKLMVDIGKVAEFLEIETLVDLCACWLACAVNACGEGCSSDSQAVERIRAFLGNPPGERFSEQEIVKIRTEMLEGITLAIRKQRARQLAEAARAAERRATERQ